MDYMDRMRIRYEERLRAEARADYAAEQIQARHNELARMQERERYVAEHGREGAFRHTLKKWTIAGAVLASLAFVGSVGENGFSKALEGSLYGFAAFIGIGAWRAYSIVNSVR